MTSMERRPLRQKKKNEDYMSTSDVEDDDFYVGCKVEALHKKKGLLCSHASCIVHRVLRVASRVLRVAVACCVLQLRGCVVQARYSVRRPNRIAMHPIGALCAHLPLGRTDCIRTKGRALSSCRAVGLRPSRTQCGTGPQVHDEHQGARALCELRHRAAGRPACVVGSAVNSLPSFRSSAVPQAAQRVS